MKKFVPALALVAAAFILGACAHHGGKQRGMHKERGPRGSSAIHWCESATDGVCSGISAAPGNCPDGKPMNTGHVVWTEGSTALVCTCGAGCACKIDPNDHTRCACGKPVRRIDLSGTGLYFCNCGGSCGCNTISDKPAACTCGMQLHQAK